MRILLVEDDALLGDGIRAGLLLASYAVDWVRDGETALAALTNHSYDACILDLGLPRKDGIEVLRELRQVKNHTPVIVLTARDTRSDKILGLDSGADHYLTKPFDLAELLAHIRALVRRAGDAPQPVLVHRAVTLDPVSKLATIDGETVALSGREYALLLDFMSHARHIRSRAQLEESLYAWSDEVESNTVEVYIHRLRKKLGADFIQTVRGLGYRLRNDDT